MVANPKKAAGEHGPILAVAPILAVRSPRRGGFDAGRPIGPLELKELFAVGVGKKAPPWIDVINVLRTEVLQKCFAKRESSESDGVAARSNEKTAGRRAFDPRGFEMRPLPVEMDAFALIVVLREGRGESIGHAIGHDDRKDVTWRERMPEIGNPVPVRDDPKPERGI